MTPRTLGMCWGLLIVAFIVLLGLEYSKWRSITTEAARAASERQRLTTEIQNREQQLVAEMQKSAGLMQNIQWTSTSGDPSAFLTRLADLAREKRMTVLAVGPLERQASPQFTKSWHSVQVRAPYREVQELAARVEQDRGVLEDVHIEPAPGQTDNPAGGGEVQARFKLTALELSPQAKLIIERTLAASGGSAKAMPGAPMGLPVPAPAQATSTTGRDPFVFLAPPAPPVRPGTQAPAAPLPEIGLGGIVSFPDGFLAIINNQIVKVGDTVNGYRVERITDKSVTLALPGTAPRTIELPEMAPAAPAPPRR